jgi:uncharacterized protein
LPLGLDAAGAGAEELLVAARRGVPPGHRACDTKERTIRPDPRSPYVLDIRELGRRPGAMRVERRTVPSPADLGTDVIGVPPGTDLELDLRLESVMEGVLVSGTVTGTATGECGRCLGEVVTDVTVDVQELYAYPDRVVSDDEDDLRELEGDLLDLEPALRDAVVLALPFQPVCRADCPGLCPTCGVRLADAPDHRHEQVDPRWAALQELGVGDAAGVDPEHDDERES